MHPICFLYFTTTSDFKKCSFFIERNITLLFVKSHRFLVNDLYVVSNNTNNSGSSSSSNSTILPSTINYPLKMIV